MSLNDKGGTEELRRGRARNMRKRRRIQTPSPSRTSGQRPRRRVTTTPWTVEDVQQPVEPVALLPPTASQQNTQAELPASTSVTGLTVDQVLQLVNVLQRDNKDKSSFNNNHLNNVIPEFDPSSKTQSIESWVRKVNECACIYDWNEKQTIHFALQKLVGLAKKWFEALPSVVHSWNSWQEKLIKAFPNEQNYGQLLEEMLSRTTRSGESYREYFYDKLTLLNRCEIQKKKAVQCITHGILDKSVRNSAQALNCEEPEDLLDFLNSQRPPDTTFVKKRSDGLNRVSSNSPAVSSERSIVCFNCRAKGHSFTKCPKPLTKCQKCHRVGHDTSDCKLSPLTSRGEVQPANNVERKTLRISSANNTNDKFFRKASLNGSEYVAYVDFGSECSLMRQTEAQRLKLTKCFDVLPVIKGFGNSSVVPLYKAFASVKLDEVEARIEVLVVNDEFLETPLLIGQDFTELPFVTVLKDNNSLCFYRSPVTESNDRESSLKLMVHFPTTVVRVGLVGVCAENSSFSGSVYVEGCCCSEPGREYRLHQGAYSLIDGKGHLVLTNLTDEALRLESGLLLARAVPVVEGEVCHVRRIARDLSPLPPIDRSDIIVDKDTSDEVVDKLHSLLQSYRDCFAFDLSEIGCAKDVEMTVELSDDRPVVYRPYRLSHSEREQLRAIIDDLINNDIIQESNSDYASPVLMVRKKSGEHRLCVDYRALNNKTRKDCFPIPLIEDQLSNLSGNRFFTTLDLASGYYQVPMAKESRRLTGFVTPDGHYEFKRMPFGLANAPGVFQRLINRMLGSKRFESALAYLDDILVPSVDLEQGIQRLEEVLKLIREFGLTLKLSKCRFFNTSIDYLGYEISVDGVRPNESKILAVRDFPTPKSVHEVRQFLGLAGYFRKFVRGFGEVARPLTNLLKKNVPFKWTEPELQAFASLKKKLVERPILSLYDPKLDTELHTDASALGVGGILLQWQQSPRVLKPVAYFSRQTAPEERHLHSYELETLAIVCSLKKFRVYLLGVKFKVVTDCHAIRTTLTKRDLVPRIARWWLQISEFTFDIEYRPGAQMAHVDALSRNTSLQGSTNDDSPTYTVYNISKDQWLLTLQISDPDIARIVKVLKPENDEDSKDIKRNFVIKDHKVYRKVDDQLRLVVPRNARFQICQSCHDDMGHLGIAKTIEKVSSLYWFPKLRSFIKKYIQSCIHCAFNKDSSTKQKKGHLHPIQKVEVPFHTIHIDHLGPFVKSASGNNYILTVVDGFTKYVFVKPVKNTKTKTTVRILESIFYDFGLPSRIVSDRGTSFTSASFKKFCDIYGIKHVLNAVACPRANGQAERFNQTILNSLSKHNAGKDERSWDTCLGKIQWGINNTINSSTQKTASEALFGIRFRDTLANKLNVGTDARSDQWSKVRADVSANIKASQEKQKRRYDAGRTPAVVYKEGDLVKITRTNFYNKGSSTKLLSKFIGPYKIAKVLGNDRYKLIDIPGFNHKKRFFETVVAADRIRPWINIKALSSDYDNNSTCSSESSGSDSDDDVPLSELRHNKTSNKLHNND